MPQAIDLVVKNGASTPVDKTFTLISPAAGYNGVAEWLLKEGVSQVSFPNLTISAARNQQRSSRTAKIRLRVPATYTDPTSGLEAHLGNFDFHATVTVPDVFPESMKADAVAFTANLLNHALIKSIVKDAVPAT